MKYISKRFFLDNGKTLEIVEKLRETNQRIILINNKKNMGILNSRSIAILRAKGEYIMNLKMFLIPHINQQKMEILILFHLCIVILKNIVIIKIKFF